MTEHSLPFKDGEELHSYLFEKLMGFDGSVPVTRFPIIGTADGKIYMQTNSINNRMQHKDLVKINLWQIINPLLN